MTQTELKDILSYNKHTGLFTKLLSGKQCGTKRSDGSYQLMINKTTYSLSKLAYLYEYNIYPKRIRYIDGDNSNLTISNLTNESMALDLLTQDRLKQLYAYNKDTGLFIKVSNNKVAGTTIQRGYIHIGIGSKKYLAHRLAFLYMNGSLPSKPVDHINHNTSDNQWSNLRLVTDSQNSRNSSLSKNNKSGQTGVIWNKQREHWMANIRIFDKRIHLGCFIDLSKAIEARKEAELKHNFHENHGSKPIN